MKLVGNDWQRKWKELWLTSDAEEKMTGKVAGKA